MDLLQLVFASVIMLATTAFVVRTSGRWGLGSFIALLFLVGFGFRAWVAYAGGYSAFGFTVDPNEIVELTWVGVVGLAACAAGLALSSALGGAPAAAPARSARLQGAASAWSLLVTLAAIAVAIQIAVLSSLYHGLSHAFLAFSQRSISGARAGGFAATLAIQIWYLAAPLALAAFYYASRSSSQLRTLISIALLLAILPVGVLVSGRAEGPVLIWSLAMIATGMAGRRVGLAWILLGVIGTGALVTGGLALRMATQSHIPIGLALEYASEKSIANVSDALPGLDAFYIAQEFVRKAGHNFSEIVVPPFTVLIPRDLWPDKPMFAPQLINMTVFGRNGSGLPAGILGEGYIALGWVGVLLFPFALGWLATAVERRLASWRGGDVLKIWLLFIAVDIALKGVRGGFQSLVIGPQLALLALPAIWVVQQLVSARLQSRRSGPDPVTSLRPSVSART